MTEVKPFVKCVDFWPGQIPENRLKVYKEMISEGQIMKHHVIFNQQTGNTTVEYRPTPSRSAATGRPLALAVNPLRVNMTVTTRPSAASPSAATTQVPVYSAIHTTIVVSVFCRTSS